MTLVVEQNYVNGMPQTAVSGWSPRACVWHWTAGGPGRIGWNGSVSHLVNTRTTVNASYHGGFWVEHTVGHTACRTYVQWVVPTTKAAHSIAPTQIYQLNPNKDRATQEARFTEVKRILLRDFDPNADCIALAYAGMPANLKQDLQCPVFRADLQNLARQIVARPDVIDRPHFGHGWIQPISRYEVDQVGIDFISMLYDEPAAPAVPAEDDMIYWRPVQQDWMTYVGTVFYDGDGNKKTFTDREPVRSTHESSDGRYRLVKYGTETLVVEARGARKEGPGLEPVPNTRVPASGFGYPPTETMEVVKEVPTGITEAQVEAAIDAALDQAADAVRALK